MKNINIDLDLDNDTVEALINIYIRENMSSASYSVYKEEVNGFMIAAAKAIQNEAIVTAVKVGMEYDNLSKT